jgi:type VI secretion system protein ImpH
MTQTHSWQSLRSDKTFFELMRRIEALSADQRQGSAKQNRIPNGVRLTQPAALQFSSSEISSIHFARVALGGQEIPEIQIEHRNFGLFAPYGPLPIHITEHAWVEKRFERNAGFEQFVNLFSSNMAWLHYKAWAAMHPALCFDRGGQAFNTRLNRLAQIDIALAERQHASVMACRAANLGVYVNAQRPLAALQRILATHFQVPAAVYPRRGRWYPSHHRANVPVQVGRWRLGRCVWDVQQTFDIDMGPIEAKHFQDWRRRSARILALDAVVRDYTEARADFAIHVWVKTHPNFAAKVGGVRLGVNTWLKPGHALKRVTVHEAF